MLDFLKQSKQVIRTFLQSLCNLFKLFQHFYTLVYVLLYYCTETVTVGRKRHKKRKKKKRNLRHGGMPIQTNAV